MTNAEIIKRLESIASAELVCDGLKVGAITKECFESIQETARLAISALSRDRWIKIESRPMTDDEREEYCENYGYELESDEAVIYTSELPDDQQDVLVVNLWGDVSVDKFEDDPDYGCSFEQNGEMDGITHWMPLPEPPKEET